MKSIFSVIFLSFAVGVGFMGCKGKTGPEGVQGPIGPEGPFGPGPTEHLYTGNFPIDPVPEGLTTDQIVQTPEMTLDSDILIHISSNSVNWTRNVYTRLDYTAKNITFQYGHGQEGYYYRILVRNFP